MVILSAFLIPYFFQSSIDNFLLYINAKFAHKLIEVKYDVVESKENNVYHLYDGKNFISQKKELDRINSHIVNGKYPSIYDYKNKDVVTVKFRNGLLNVKYLE